MKYADIKISCRKFDTNYYAVGLCQNRIHIDSRHVSLSTREKGASYMNYFSVNSYISYRQPCLSTRELRFSYSDSESIEDKIIKIENKESGEILVRKINLEEFISSMITALYYWDKRCQRSVNVKGKLTKDNPVIINYDGLDVSVPLERMLEFASYISNNNKGV